MSVVFSVILEWPDRFFAMISSVLMRSEASRGG